MENKNLNIEIASLKNVNTQLRHEYDQLNVKLNNLSINANMNW